MLREELWHYWSAISDHHWHHKQQQKERKLKKYMFLDLLALKCMQPIWREFLPLIFSGQAIGLVGLLCSGQQAKTQGSPRWLCPDEEKQQRWLTIDHFQLKMSEWCMLGHILDQASLFPCSYGKRWNKQKRE